MNAKKLYELLEGCNIQKFLSACSKHEAEASYDDNAIVLRSPYDLAEEAKAEIAGTLPEGVTLKFIAAPKSSTITDIRNLLDSVHAPGEATTEPGSATIRVEGIEEDHPVWGELSNVLRKDRFFKSWKFIVNGKEMVVNPKVVDEIEKNARLRARFGDDDMLNLKIALESTQDVNDFINSL
jgi:hypothetical protein